MKERTEQLLKFVVEHYIETATPVGSQFLTEKTGLDVSAATVRNELAALEEEGYLTHPHTSAGRIPTEAGYRLYIDRLMEKKKVAKSLQEEIGSFSAYGDRMTRMKLVAKTVAHYTHSAVIIAFDLSTVYYTGISNLFSEPEFHEIAHTVNISSVFDTVEEHVDELFESLQQTPTTLLGSQNPFGSVCGLVGARIGEKSAIALLGPMRMDYGTAISIVEHITTI